jgi:hypothetical protein
MSSKRRHIAEVGTPNHCSEHFKFEIVSYICSAVNDWT